MASELLELAKIITNSVTHIDARCRDLSQSFPHLDETLDPQSETIRLDEDITQATDRIIAAASQLIACVRIPATSLLTCASGFLLSAALGTVSSGAIAEILSEAGPQGLNVAEIAKKSHMDPSKLSRLLRSLATHHIFREVSPDVFAHTRISSLLDTGKPAAAVVDYPMDKYDGARGISPMVECFTDESFKAAGYMKETLMDPATSHSEEPTKCAHNHAFKTNLDLFSWYGKPENTSRLKRFSMVMESSRRLSPPEAVLQGFDWSALPAGRRVIDVGGGVGSSSMAISKAHPSLTVVIQDTPDVVKLAEKYWRTEHPTALDNLHVVFQAHNFFDPQPPENRGNAVFLLRFILHDWSNTYALEILTNLREAAAPDSKLVIMDYIVPYACRPETAAEHNIPGAANLGLIKDPGPLLPNMGIAGALPYLSDLLLMVVLNGQERTLGQFAQLLKGGGWRIEQVYRLQNGLQQQQLVAVPI